MAKKSFNPFKMWGAWVGFVLALIAVFLVGFVFVFLFSDGKFLISLNVALSSMIGINDAGEFIEPFKILITLGIGVVGFLIGWGIHSIVRASK